MNADEVALLIATVINSVTILFLTFTKEWKK